MNATKATHDEQDLGDLRAELKRKTTSKGRKAPRGPSSTSVLTPPKALKHVASFHHCHLCMFVFSTHPAPAKVIFHCHKQEVAACEDADN